MGSRIDGTSSAKSSQILSKTNKYDFRMYTAEMIAELYLLSERMGDRRLAELLASTSKELAHILDQESP